MADNFEVFDESARRVLSTARQEADRLQHGFIGTEHLLLALTQEEDGATAQVFLTLAVDRLRVRSAVEFLLPRGERPVLSLPGLTPRAKKVVELAVDEARRMNSQHVRPEHLLLALVAEGEGIAAGVLESVGINLQNMRTALAVTREGALSPIELRELTSPTPTLRPGSSGTPKPATFQVTEAGLTYDFQASEGGYVVSIAAAPGCWSEGDDFETALRNIKDAHQGWRDAQDGGAGVPARPRPSGG